MGKKTIFNNGNGLKIFIGELPPEFYYKNGISSIYGFYQKNAKMRCPYWRNKNFLSNMLHIKNIRDISMNLQLNSAVNLPGIPYNWTDKKKYYMEQNVIKFDIEIYKFEYRGEKSSILNLDVLSIQYDFCSTNYKDILNKYIFKYSYDCYKHIDFLIHELDYVKFKEIKNYLEEKNLCVSDHFLGDPV